MTRNEPAGPAAGLRLQVFLARAGVASRRAAEELIREGLVSVNGHVVTRLGTRVEPEHDHVKVRGKLVRGREPTLVLMLNKPRGVVSTASDPEGRQTVLDLVRSRGLRLFPVGRLDLQSEGLLLLTNDGELAQSLLHPSSEVPRVYRAKVRGSLDDKTRRRLGAGPVVEGKRFRPIRVRVIEEREGSSWLELEVREGRKHLIRDALAALGHPVVKLRRVALGPLRLGKLALGESRPLDERELHALRRLMRRSGSGGRANATTGRPDRRRARRPAD